MSQSTPGRQTFHLQFSYCGWCLYAKRDGEAVTPSTARLTQLTSHKDLGKGCRCPLHVLQPTGHMTQFYRVVCWSFCERFYSLLKGGCSEQWLKIPLRMVQITTTLILIQLPANAHPWRQQWQWLKCMGPKYLENPEDLGFGLSQGWLRVNAANRRPLCLPFK